MTSWLDKTEAEKRSDERAWVAAQGRSWSHEEIADLARALARAHDRLRETIEPVREEQRRIVRRRSRAIRNRAAELAAAREALHAAIEQSPELFDRPRTRAQDGVRYGLRKRPGRLGGDADAIMARVRAKMPERSGELLQTRTTLVKAALMRLTAAELASLGASIVDAEDAVTIKVARTDDLERFVEIVMADVEDDPAA